MSENDVFVKRVEINNNINTTNSNNVSSPVKEKINLINKGDVEKSNDLKKSQSCKDRFNSFLDKFKIKAALSHVGLLLSLGLYCFFGGFVSWFIQSILKNITSSRIDDQRATMKYEQLPGIFILYYFTVLNFHNFHKFKLTIKTTFKD